MNVSLLALAAKKVIDATWLHGDAYDLSSQAAFALESAQMLQSPETAAESAKLRQDYAEAVATVARLVQERGERMKVENAVRDESEELRARLAELEERLAEYERPADEDPIRYALTEQADAEVFVPRTEREHWVAIAAALNAAHAAGMPVGIDLDGTLTDHRMWSVVWDRAAEQWTVAGYEGGDAR